jgi:NAD(P)H-hydrate epimerase
VIRVLDAGQARWLDGQATAAGLSGLALMEAAAAKATVVAAEIIARGRRLEPGVDLSGLGARVVIACGPGNNGGDGIALARHLRSLGVEVELFLVAGSDRLPAEAAANLAAWRAVDSAVAAARRPQDLPATAARRPQDLPVAPARSPHDLPAALARPTDLVVDALLGIGQSRPPDGPIAAAIEAIIAARGGCNCAGNPWPVLALDVPTGLCSDTGLAYRPAMRADVTVTFGLPKIGLMTGDGPALAGEVILASIGLPAISGPAGLSPDAEHAMETALAPARAYVITAASAAPALPPRPRQAHKGDAGRLLVLAGSAGMAGAAALCGLGALRGGAGLVTVASPPAAQPAVAAHLPEALTAPLCPHQRSDAGRAGAARHLTEAMVEQALASARAADAVALGPGLGNAPETFRAIRQLVSRIQAPLVLDADGINAFAGEPELLASSRPDGSHLVLTPHPGELARLLGTTAAAVQADRPGHARRAAQLAKAICLLKGSGAVVADPAGTVWLVPAGNQGMATGGMGDVLTGLIGAYMAPWRHGGQPTSLTLLVAAAALVHAVAGDLSAREVGTIGLGATDVANRLPRARDIVAGVIASPPALGASLKGVKAFV